MENDDIALKKLLEIKGLIHIFKDLEEAEILSIISDVNFQKFAVTETVIYEHDTDRLIYYILKGSCDVRVHNQKVAELEKGKLFGEMSSILNKPRNATVKATQSDTTLISFKIDMNDLSKNYSAFAKLFKNISIDLSEKVDKVNKLLLT